MRVKSTSYHGSAGEPGCVRLGMRVKSTSYHGSAGEPGCEARDEGKVH